MQTLILLILSICLGSFIPCFAERRQKSISQKGRSYCMNCGHVLSPKDLIPIFSYLHCHGRCRYFGTAIPIMLPVVECLSMIVGIILALSAHTFFHGILLLFCFACLLLLSIDDWQTQHIHDSDLLLLACVLIIDTFFFGSHQWLSQLIGACLVSLPLLVISHFWPNALGNGDGLFMAITGFYLGYSDITTAFLIGTLSALCYALVLLIRNKASVKTALPLIPFLSTGVLITILAENIFFIIN